MIGKLFRMSFSLPVSFTKLPKDIDTYWFSSMSGLHKTHSKPYEFPQNDLVSQNISMQCTCVANIQRSSKTQITNQMQQFSSLLSWHLLTAQHVSGVFPPIIRSSMTAVAASDYTFVSWWHSCCVRGRANYNRPDHEHSTTVTTIRR